MGRRVRHLDGGLYGSSACGRVGGPPGSRVPVARAFAVTCRLCMHTRLYRRLHETAVGPYRDALGDLVMEEREHIPGILAAMPEEKRERMLVALDRYEETPPDERDPAALARELCPVEPGWLS